MTAWLPATRLVLGVVCLALLTSMGGAGIYAAPLTLPLLWFAARGAGRTGAILLMVVAMLTAAEAGWFVGYEIGGPAEWLVPLGAGGAVALLFLRTARA